MIDLKKLRIFFFFLLTMFISWLFLPSKAIAALPSAVDNRRYDTSIKDQDGYGTCWAHAAAAVVEAKYKMQAGGNIDLSEKFLSTCCNRKGSNPDTCGFCYGCGSCDGGWPEVSLNFIKDYGIVDQQCLPGINCSSCSEKCADWQSRLYKVSSSNCYNQPSIEQVKKLLSAKNPLTANIFDWYDGNDGHAVEVSGYDDNSDICLQAYGVSGCWIIKNSWGSTNGWVGSLWHENGYFYFPYKRTAVGDDEETESINQICTVGSIILPGPYTVPNQKISGSVSFFGNSNTSRTINNVLLRFIDEKGIWYDSQKYRFAGFPFNFHYEVSLPPGNYRPFLAVLKDENQISSITDTSNVEVKITQGEDKTQDLNFSLERRKIYGQIEIVRNKYTIEPFDEVSVQYQGADGTPYESQRYRVEGNDTSIFYEVFLPSGEYQYPSLRYFQNGEYLSNFWLGDANKVAVPSDQDAVKSLKFDVRRTKVFGTIHILTNEKTFVFDRIVLEGYLNGSWNYGRYFAWVDNNVGDKLLDYDMFVPHFAPYFTYLLNFYKGDNRVGYDNLGNAPLGDEEEVKRDFEFDLRDQAQNYCPGNWCVSPDACNSQSEGINLGQVNCESGKVCCEGNSPDVSVTPPVGTSAACCFATQKCGGKYYGWGERGCQSFQKACDYCGVKPNPAIPINTPTPTPIPRSYCDGNTLVNTDKSRTFCPQGCENVDENPADGVYERARCTGFGSCGDCSTCLSADKSLCITVYQEGTCAEYNETSPCCLRDETCNSNFQYSCGYGDNNTYCHKCTRYANSSPWCSNWDLTCGAGRPAQPRTKSPPNGFSAMKDKELALSWYSFGEGFKEKCGEKLSGTFAKWQDCYDNWIINDNKNSSAAQCVPEIQGKGASDRDCWGYTCTKGSFGIPPEWRYYELFVKKPGETEFSSVCKLTNIPNPPPSSLGWIQNIPDEKKSCKFTPEKEGQYSWYVKAGYVVSTGGGIATGENQSPVSTFIVGKPNLIANCALDNQNTTDTTQVTLSWDTVLGASFYALRVDNLANPWDESCGANSQAEGDICIDKIWGTSYTLAVKKDQAYKYWIQAISASNIWGPPLESTFTCSQRHNGPGPGGVTTIISPTPISPTPTQGNLAPAANITTVSPTTIPSIVPSTGQTSVPTPVPSGQCETCKMYAAQTTTTTTLWQELTAPLSLKKGQKVYLATKGTLSNTQTQNLKARFRINQTADTSWCSGNGLTLTTISSTNKWCETTLKHDEYFYVPYTFNTSGRFKIESMLYNLEVEWY